MKLDRNELPPLENLLLAALHLATSYAKDDCPLLSRALLHQLQCLIGDTRGDLSPTVKQTCKQLYDAWAGIHAARALAFTATAPVSVIRRVH